MRCPLPDTGHRECFDECCATRTSVTARTTKRGTLLPIYVTRCWAMSGDTGDVQPPRLEADRIARRSQQKGSSPRRRFRCHARRRGSQIPQRSLRRGRRPRPRLSAPGSPSPPGRPGHCFRRSVARTNLGGLRGRCFGRSVAGARLGAPGRCFSHSLAGVKLRRRRGCFGRSVARVNLRRRRGRFGRSVARVSLRRRRRCFGRSVAGVNLGRRELCFRRSVVRDEPGTPKTLLPVFGG